jgi:hypothetical protein
MFAIRRTTEPKEGDSRKMSRDGFSTPEIVSEECELQQKIYILAAGCHEI